MTIVKEGEGSKNRALLKPESTPAPAPAPAQDEDEGYVTQPSNNNNNNTSSNQPDDDEGYVTNTTTTNVASVGADEDEGYVTQPTTSNNNNNNNNNNDVTQPASSSNNNNNAVSATSASAAAAGGSSSTNNNNNKNDDKKQEGKEGEATAATGEEGEDGMKKAKKPPGPDEWQTKLLAYGSSGHNPVPWGECLYGCCLPCCAAPIAKAEMDGSHKCYNCLCWHPGASLTWIRARYGIKGLCGEDMMKLICCMPCVSRQMVSEVRLRGECKPPAWKEEQDSWKEELCDCSCGGFMQALCCPACQAHEVRLFMHNPKEIDCCFDCCCLPPCGMYGQVRHYNHLPPRYVECSDGCFEDVCVATFCYPCFLNQAVREARIRKGF